jgi:class 3 adenylate cyclase
MHRSTRLARLRVNIAARLEALAEPGDAHSGRIVKLTGDGMLMEFASVTATD